MNKAYIARYGKQIVAEGTVLRLLAMLSAVCIEWVVVYSFAANQAAHGAEIDSALASSTRTPRQIEVVTPDGRVVCNSDAFSQFTSDRDLFVGRVSLFADGQLAVGTHDECGHRPLVGATLALFRMDWKLGRLVLGRTIIRTPIEQLPLGGRLATAYDPYLVTVGGQDWIAFECLALGNTNACVAPLLPNHVVDVSRLSIPVRGHANVAATVPKLLGFDGKIYLYWGVPEFEELTHERIRVTSRGMELTIDAAGRLWGLGTGGRSVWADDTSRFTHLVAAPNSQDPTANMRAELLSVRVVDRNRLEALVAVGATGCDNPGSPVPGCYRIMKSFASEPLAENAFGGFEPMSVLPVNPQEYTRYFLGPDGTPIVMGMFLRPRAPFGGNTVPVAYWQFPAE